jgi:hypothetical protein
MTAATLVLAASLVSAESAVGVEGVMEPQATWPATRDTKNNVENVFLESVPANASVKVRVKVGAGGLLHDAIGMNYFDPPRQDFALVIYNAHSI